MIVRQTPRGWMLRDRPLPPVITGTLPLSYITTLPTTPRSDIFLLNGHSEYAQVITCATFRERKFGLAQRAHRGMVQRLRDLRRRGTYLASLHAELERKTGHPHAHLESVLENYENLLKVDLFAPIPPRAPDR